MTESLRNNQSREGDSFMAELEVSVASIFVSPLIGQVTKSVLDATANGARKGELLEGEIRMLDLKLASIRDVVEDAESKQVRNAPVRAWLQELNGIMYDADDALDEYATAVAIRRTAGGIWKKIKTKHSCLMAANKIKSINKRLENTINGIQKLGLLKVEESDHVNSNHLQTKSLTDIDSHVFDREDAKREVIELLTADATESNNTMLHVLPIVGVEGIGKTTLAHLVFNDDSKVNKWFDLNIWICVSNDFDMEKLSRKFINFVCSKGTKKERRNLAHLDLERLHNEVVKLVEGKRILLILDDAWNSESNMWDQLLKLLKLAKCGSRIVVTTRNEGVVKAISNCLHPFCLKGPFFLNGLTKEGLWRIIERFAFTNKDNASDYKQLEEIGMEIAEKLKGSPLAAKTVGRVLSRSLTVGHWKKILTSELWKLKQHEDDILPSLMLSYQHLDAYLKQCVSLCSLFPKDYCFDKEMMANLWMAHNFFQVESGMSLNEIGEKLIEELLSWSFFQREMHNLKMHDLVHDLALLTSQEDHLRLADIILKEYPRTIRHVSLDATRESPKPSTLKIPSKNEKLRTLLCLNYGDSFNYNRFDVSSMLGEWFEKLRCLRVLVLAGCKINELPKSISNLKQLRYLDLSYTDISKLPDSLTTLYNLQVLSLCGCSYLNSLPSGMRNLVNLRHLEKFYVGKKKGHGIEELENLDKLGGTLSIKNLENVRSQKHAGKAKLHEKIYLRELNLAWHGGNNASIQNSQHAQAVLEALRPSSDLHSLQLKGYTGTKPPNWLSNQDSVHYLESIHLVNCNELENLPSLGTLKHLKKLWLFWIAKLRCIGQDFYGNGEGVIFPSLEELTLNSMPKLEEWEGAEDGKWLFPHLKELRIVSCPVLRSMPSALPITLERFILGGVGLKTLPMLQGGNEGRNDLSSSLSVLKIYDCEQLSSIGMLDGGSLPPPLQELEISRCGVTDRTLRKALQGLTSLQQLILDSCHKLSHWFEKGLVNTFLGTLRYVKIVDEGWSFSFTARKDSTCDAYIEPPATVPRKRWAWELLFEVLDQMGTLEVLDIRYSDITCIDGELEDHFFNLASLRWLYIWGCRNLLCLPPKLSSLSSLQHLTIRWCSNLHSLPADMTKLSSLQRLMLFGCDQLQSLPDMRGLSSLQMLNLEDCYQLQSLPDTGLPASLQELTIANCPTLKQQYDKRERSPGWHIISHIPEIDIV